MRKLISIFLIIISFSCIEKKNSEKNSESIRMKELVTELKDFDLVQDFETNKVKFAVDTFELNNHSADGGELKVFHEKSFDYIVYDFWLFGETGKLNYTYWTEKNGKMNFKFIKQLKYEYDKPYYEEGYKIDSIIYYLSYSDSKSKLFDSNKLEILESSKVKDSKIELESFFRDVIEGVEFVK